MQNVSQGPFAVGAWKNLTILSTNETHSNSTTNSCLKDAKLLNCYNGWLIPLWEPPPWQISSEIRAIRSILLVMLMAYLFLGISIITDKFTEVVDVVVSQKRRVRVVSRLTGEEEVVLVPIWNETVAHMTLAVVGSCSPEILLALIEVLSHGFSLGEMGPSTIIGAGAYNLFIICSICILAVKSGETKRINDLHTFIVTGVWSLFAYVWILIITSVSSPGIIEVWEAVLTLIFFPMTVVSSYLANKKCFHCSRVFLRQQNVVEPAIPKNGETPQTSNLVHHQRPAEHLANKLRGLNISLRNDQPREILALKKFAAIVENEESGDIEVAHKNFHSREKQFVDIETKLRSKFPEKSDGEIIELAEMELIESLPKSRSYYRTMSMRRWAGAGNVFTREKLRRQLSRSATITEHLGTDKLASSLENHKQFVFFEPVQYVVVEDMGSFDITVRRDGLDFDNEISVHYSTMEGTAKANIDFKPIQGRLLFKRFETIKQISIEVIDDDIFNEDTVFYVTLEKPLAMSPTSNGKQLEVNLGKEIKATITKLDDDHGGLFHFELDTVTVEESIGFVHLTVKRSAGGKGKVLVPIHIIAGTALPNVHFINASNVRVEFENHQNEAFVDIEIVNEGKLDKQVNFQVVLDEPQWALDGNQDEGIDTTSLGAPRIKSPASVTVVIVASQRLRQIVDNLANIDYANFVTTSSWNEQFRDALTISGGQEGLGPKWYDYILHFISLFWKLLIAAVPPTEKLYGWPASFVCFVFVAFFTLLIADLAEQLGCTMGLRKDITAITLVALGITLPDMLASRIAAKNEKSADAAIGHISGASAINVFFGIGLAWTLAAVKNAIDGNQLHIRQGSIGYTLTIYFAFAAAAIAVLMIRRFSPIGGELGGPLLGRIATVVLFFTFWISYVSMSALDSYCLIRTY